jgi:hypothetical protein
MNTRENRERMAALVAKNGMPPPGVGAGPAKDQAFYGCGYTPWEKRLIRRLSFPEYVIYQSKRGKVLEVNPGQRFFDWTPPEEMEIEEAFVRGQDWRVVERRRRT